MKTKIVIFVGLLFVSSFAAFNFNADDCKAEKFDNWDSLYCPCSGGSGDYEYQFTKLPPGWYANKDRILIPRGRVQNRFYSPKVAIFDKNKKQYIKRSLIFNYDESSRIGKVYEGDYDQDYDDKPTLDRFFNNRNRNDNSYISNQNIVDQVIVRNDYNNAVPSQIIPNFQPIRRPEGIISESKRPDVIVPNIISPRADNDDRRRNPYYEAFPRDQEIDQAISNADCGRIRDIINFVSNSGFNCKIRAEYLQKFQSKIQAKIAAYRSDAQKDKQQIFSLQEQIKNLKAQIQKITQGPQYNDDDDQRVKGYRSQIDRHRRDRDGYENQCRVSRQSIDKLRAEIDSITSETQQSRGLFQRQQRVCQQIDNRIAELEAQIRQLKKQKQSSYQRRQRHRYVISDSDRRVKECNSKINEHQDRINGFQTKRKYCSSAIDEYSKKIEECGKDNQRRRQGRDLNRNKIVLLDQQVAELTKQSQRLVKLYTQIEKYENQFQGIINKHYYGCYQYTPKDGKDEPSFTAPSSAFLSYMKEIFGQAPNENIRARFSGAAVNIKRNSIFSPAWTKVYGIPYTAGYGNNKDVSQDNFSCTETTDKLKVFSGRIQTVTKNVIEVVSKSGERYTVHLGGCTKIESVTEKELPEKGSQIYFKGYQRSNKGHYNGYHVTCY